MEFNTKDIIIYSTLVILVILVIYILVKQKKNCENFDVNNVNNNAAINSLGTIAANIMNTTTGTLTMPADTTVFTGDATITGSLTATALSQFFIDLVLPSGMIVSYNSTTVPAGWALCDGTIPTGSTTATPDLRGRFIIGDTGTNFTATAIASAYTLGITGGAEQHTLTVAEMPAHSHNMTANPNNSQWTGWAMPTWGLLGSGTNTPSEPTTITGGGSPYNIMPPYYVLVYIIKL